MSKSSWSVDIDSPALVASGGAHSQTYFPVEPPKFWFAKKKYDKPHAVKYGIDGAVFGYVALWSAEHTAFNGKKVTAPKSKTNYAYFMIHDLVTEEGDVVKTGTLTSDTCHPDIYKFDGPDAQKFYDNTGCAVADVCVYEDDYGIQIAGALRPNVEPSQVRSLRGSDVSPDWRPTKVKGTFRKHREMIGLLACNLSGFITPALVASGAECDTDDLVEAGSTCILMSDCESEPEGMFGSSWGVELESHPDAGGPTIARLEQRVELLESLLSDEIRDHAFSAFEEDEEIVE